MDKFSLILIFMQILLAIIIFIASRWWFFLPLVFFLVSVLVYFNLLNSTFTITTIIILCLSFSIFSRTILSPVINNFGILSVGKVINYSPTMFSDSSYKRVYSIDAEIFNLKEWKAYRVNYYDTVRRVFPVFSNFNIPSIKNQYFLVKYLESLPSEFIFLSELSKDDTNSICSLLSNLKHAESLNTANELNNLNINEIRNFLANLLGEPHNCSK
ncbi:hypothetical protein KUM_1230 [Taylorella asinigenitalis 14/45]|uniref:Transmembrane protein n=1 Tax=Taylorella asinigenitalis 14/45 TaxID=1091495 RepID=I7IC64_9BURK|nr:hypothetical protein KUM_1230 [Taylorella asinigenitalis 14/45]